MKGRTEVKGLRTEEGLFVFSHWLFVKARPENEKRITNYEQPCNTQFCYVW
jgi:hypothetical protein